MMKMKIQIDIKAVEEMIKHVGDYQLERFRCSDLKIDDKTTSIDLVTEVDLESERRIIAWIQVRYPSHNILSEEIGALDRGSEYTWILDPLDGTTNYASGVPIFAISLALHYRGTRFMGWVYIPYFNDFYYAVKGQGAYYNGKRLKSIQDRSLSESVVATGFPYDRAINPDNNVKRASQVIPHVRGFRRLGAAAYDLCLVAHGAYHLFWEKGLKDWDVEAGLLMIEEIGGIVMTTDQGVLVAGSRTAVKDFLSKINKD
jgi:myo-inositol-1(or 4)-monophosphatase